MQEKTFLCKKMPLNDIAWSINLTEETKHTAMLSSHYGREHDKRYQHTIHLISSINTKI